MSSGFFLLSLKFLCENNKWNKEIDQKTTSWRQINLNLDEYLLNELKVLRLDQKINMPMRIRVIEQFFLGLLK